MVSPSSSADDASSGSMEEKEKEKRVYNTSRQPPPSSSSSESQSESDEQPPPTNVAASSKPSSKRPRDEEQQSRGLQKKPQRKKAPSLEAAKPQSEKKTNEDKKKLKKSDSPPKSAKKNGPLWYTQDEIRLLKGVLAYQASKGLPKTNLTPVYEYIRKLNHLEHDYTNSQMSDKLRRLKRRFVGLKDNDHRFKNPHEETLYKLCRKIWESGEEEEESTDGEDEKNAVEDGENAVEPQGVERVEKEDEASASQGNLASNGAQKQSNTKENGKLSSVSHVVHKNGSAIAGKLIDALRKENLAMMNEIKDQPAREKQEIKNEIMTIVREACQSSMSTGTSNYVQFSSEEMIKRISSTRVWPPLEKAEAERLEHKWQKQNLIELDASSKHLQLLQEECQFRMEKLRSQVDERNL